MDNVIGAIVNNTVTPLCGLIRKRCGDFFNVKENLDSLTRVRQELENMRGDVEEKAVSAEQRGRGRRTQIISGWLERVQLVLREVNDILRRGDEENHKTCLRKTCFPGNWCSRQKLGKEASEKIDAVKELLTKGQQFDVVAENLRRPRMNMIPIVETVGLDSIISEVWTCIRNEREKVIGIYGMGGVGKSTLLQKLNNSFHDTNNDFDLVIWVKVSKNASLKEIQESVLKRLEIPDTVWGDKDAYVRANEILRNLRDQKFVLLLDNLRERLDITKVGLSHDGNQNGSKIVFTTRSEEVCGQMEAHKRFKVECLSPEAAMYLFRRKVGEDVFNSHPEIPKLAQIVVEECKGLPLALVTIGHAMASRTGPSEWQHAVHRLQSDPFKFEGMEKSVFHILRFSYDSLSGDNLKKCFVYCSLFPEGHNIRKDELIQLWVGEGFFNLDFPRTGDFIIGSLKLACLLERGDESEDFVKMHSLIRDMALELASENNKKTLVVENHAGLIESINNFSGWNESVRMSLWGSGVNFSTLVEAPSCPLVRTLLARLTMLPTLPNSTFFRSMNELEVLDLSYNLDLKQLPQEIGELETLRHLNLSNTSIERLPIEIKNLIKLKILLLDGMQCLECIPGVISSLSSLQVFSWFSSELVDLINPLSNETDFLDELESLVHMTDLSVTLFSKEAVNRILISSKLQSCIRRLALNDCHDHLPLGELGSLLGHLETLHIVKCVFPERVVIDREPFPELCHLSISSCKEVRDLTWLIHIPRLQFLSLRECDPLAEIIGAYASGSAEIEESQNYFSNLKVVDLDSLPRLRSICGRTLAFPSLQTISVINCPHLKKLPFNSGSAMRSLISIRGSVEWWEQLRWEDDEAAKDGFAAKFRKL